MRKRMSIKTRDKISRTMKGNQNARKFPKKVSPFNLFAGKDSVSSSRFFRLHELKTASKSQRDSIMKYAEREASKRKSPKAKAKAFRNALVKRQLDKGVSISGKRGLKFYKG